MSEPHLIRERHRIREKLADRPRQGVTDGDLSTAADPEALAYFVDTILAGMSARSRDGATHAQLTAVVDHALAVF